MSIKGKLSYISVVLWLQKKSVYYRKDVLSVGEPVPVQSSLCISGGQPSLRIADLKEDKHTRVGHLEGQKWWPSSLYHYKVLRIQTPLAMLLCHTCPALPTSSQHPSHLVKLVKAIMSAFQPSHRETRKTRVLFLSKRTSQNFQRHFSFRLFFHNATA